MFQLRIYTLRSAEALDRYAAIHWASHIGSLEAVGVETRGIWTSRDGDENRLFALVSYKNGADPARVETEYMAGSAFAEDMAGFDPDDIVDVTSVLLAATTSSPISADRTFLRSARRRKIRPWAENAGLPDAGVDGAVRGRRLVRKAGEVLLDEAFLEVLSRIFGHDFLPQLRRKLIEAFSKYIETDSRIK